VPYNPGSGTPRMPDRLITHLRHVDIAAPDFNRELDFSTRVWGLTQVGGDTGVAFLAAEGSPEQHVVRLRKGSKRPDLIAFGAENPAHVDGLAAKLATAGVPIVSEPRPLGTLGGGYGFRFFDVDGRTIEVSSDVAVIRHRAASTDPYLLIGLPSAMCGPLTTSCCPPTARSMTGARAGRGDRPPGPAGAAGAGARPCRRLYHLQRRDHA
jgi:catechol 2,3-dioxygenase-like lactoylglutathione lyase family enzyme